MSDLWAIPMLISGGLFAGGVGSIAWERLPAWRETDLPDFRTAFAHTLRRVDRLQPALLAVCLLSTVGFALSADGAARTSAVLAAAGFLSFSSAQGRGWFPSSDGLSQQKSNCRRWKPSG